MTLRVDSNPVMQTGDALVAGHLLDNRYRINKVVGAGGMGRVYLANDIRLSSRPVAVKEMLVGEAAHERKAMEDFAREARVLAMLSHPGIPNIIDYFTEGARHYLVMEYVSGSDLQRMLDKRGAGAKMPEPEVLGWSRQILEVFEFLHSQSPPIVYRDLKPGNIMVDKDGRAMLVDFGIARFLPPSGRGTQIGSVGYAPPEQYMGKTEPRSDLYSLAATMHHLLTGRDPQLAPPFSFPPVRQLAPEVSAKTEAAVTRGLEKDLDKRFANAREMRLALPDPGPNLPAGASGTQSKSDIGAKPLATMATVVLKDPIRRDASAGRSAAVSQISHLPTQANLVSGPQLTPLPMAPRPQPSVSSTAKTQELKPIIAKPAPLMASKPMKPAEVSSPVRTLAGAPSAQPLITPAARVAANKPTEIRRGIRPQAESSGSARLVSRSEDAQFALKAPRTVIGRSGGTEGGLDIDLAALRRGGSRVSRRHAEVVRQNGVWFIRDLGSLNGTYIVGRGRLGRDQLYKLKDRDEVVLGDARLEFRNT